METTLKPGTVEYRAMQAIKNCLKVKPKEKIVIITDINTKFIADELKKNCDDITPGNTQIFTMENFGERPDDGSNPLKFPEEIGNAMKDADVSIYAASGKMGELKSFRMPMLDIVEENKILRHGHMPNINKTLMEQGMSVDYDMVQKISHEVADIASKSKWIKVTTPAGTDFTAYFNLNWKWVISDGLIQADNWSNLPDGEVFTCVESIPEGTIVVDGTLGDYFCEKYGKMEKYPLTLTIKDSRVIDMKCDNQAIIDDLSKYIKQDENADRIGEFAIGTNLGLKELVGNLLQDEKFPGIHVAIGHGYSEKTGSGWMSAGHVDCVLKNCTITCEDKVIMQDGKFLI